MAYQTPITIKTAIEEIKKLHYVLPSIQREFVWSTEQIERLFDSLMRDYPISTFLFWEVDKNKIKDFQFYEFLKKYHEKNNRHNQKADLSDEEDITALLDGQQRMTSMYIALSGTYSERLPRHRRDSDHAYPEKKLYLNLLKPSDDLEAEYDFKFLTEDDAKPCETEGRIFWFECGKILEIADEGKISIYLMKNKLMDTSIYSEVESEYAIITLNKFFQVVHHRGTISYYLEKGEELDKVLQIFIRTNSGGTKLSYSDLLLSIATAQWQDKDAREVIHEFVDEINQIGDGFSFNKDIVLKSCLVLADFDVKFKVDNFTKENMKVIEENWDKTASAFRASVELVSKLGYSRDNLIASNAMIPIAYFIYKNNFADKIVHSGDREQDRKAIKEWIARVFLKGTFGGTSDSIYPIMRKVINHNIGKFPLDEIIEEYKGRTKSISFTEDDIDNAMDLQYGKPKTYCVLTMLYPGLNSSFNYHQDHIHPKSFFNKKALSDKKFSREQIDSYIEKHHCLSNLQLLQSTQNIEKSDKSFSEWIEKTFTEKAERDSFLMQNHIATNQSLAFEDFEDFYNARYKTLKERLMSALNVSVSN